VHNYDEAGNITRAGWEAFALPSKNIVCSFYGVREARCQIFEFSFDPAPDPDPERWTRDPEATGQWIGSDMWVDQGQAGAGMVSGDPTLAWIMVNNGDDIDILEYGQYAQTGDVLCLSQEPGLTCWDQTTKHGFFLSRETYSVW